MTARAPHLEFDASAIIDRLNELSNKAAALASGIIRLGIDKPSASGLRKFGLGIIVRDCKSVADLATG